MAKEIDWEEKIEKCNSAFDLLKLEKEFLDSGDDNLDNFYGGVWYNKIDELLGRAEVFQDVEDLKEEVKQLKMDLRKHTHSNGKVFVEYWE